MPISKNLRYYREMAGLSQDELAEKAGVAQNTITSIETGKSKGYPKIRRKLAAALGIEVKDLLKDVS